MTLVLKETDKNLLPGVELYVNVYKDDDGNLSHVIGLLSTITKANKFYDEIVTTFYNGTLLDCLLTHTESLKILSDQDFFEYVTDMSLYQEIIEPKAWEIMQEYLESSSAYEEEDIESYMEQMVTQEDEEVFIQIGELLYQKGFDSHIRY